MLPNAFQRVLTLEAGLQLAEGVHLGRPYQVMWIYADSYDSCSHDGLMDVSMKCM